MCILINIILKMRSSKHKQLYLTSDFLPCSKLLAKILHEV